MSLSDKPTRPRRGDKVHVEYDAEYGEPEGSPVCYYVKVRGLGWRVPPTAKITLIQRNWQINDVVENSEDYLSLPIGSVLVPDNPHAPVLTKVNNTMTWIGVASLPATVVAFREGPE